MRRAPFGVCVTVGVVLAGMGGSSASARSQASARPCVKPSFATAWTIQAVAPQAHGVLYRDGKWSRDGGRNWSPTPLCRDGVYGFSPAQKGLVYRYSQSRVSRSTDFGATWTNRGGRVVGGEESFLTPDTKDPNTLCLDFSDRQASYPSKLSTDGGVTWKDSFACNTLARVGRGGPLVSLLPGEFLLRRSIDGGTTWPVTPTDLLPYGDIVLAADPAAPRSLYARHSIDAETRSHSVDGGIHWTPLTVPAGVNPGTLVTELFDPARPGTIVDYQFGHLWLSRDTGATWTQGPQVLASAPTGFDGAGDLYTIGKHVRVSHDDGLTWSTRS
jgi:hypothetical protein